MGASGIIGRERDLAAMDDWLTNRNARVMTLRGPGGAGKTTLAREFARLHEALFIELEPCRTAEDLLSALGHGLGVPPSLDAVRAKVEGRVVVLDNVEQLVPDVRSLLVELGGVGRFLATSRERIDADGEYVWDLGALSPEQARTLFIRRAEMSSPRFRENPPSTADVDVLVARLDRLPLAIELAASRASLMSVSQIVARLDEKFDILTARNESVARHAAMDACIEWSWELLSEDLRSALRQFGVFRSSFTLHDAEQVVDVGGWPGDALQQLVDHSLLSVSTDDPPTYTIYGAVRRFLARHSKLDADVLERMLDHLAAAPESADVWNLISAIELGFEISHEKAAELLVASRSSLFVRGVLRQLPRLFERACEFPLTDSLMARVYTERAYTGEALETGDVERWLGRAGELASTETVADRRTQANIAMLRAHRAHREGDDDAADRFIGVARAALESLGDATISERTRLITGAGFSKMRRGDLPGALGEFQEAHEIASRGNDAASVGRTAGWVGLAQVASGDLASGRATLRRGLELLASLNELTTRAHTEHVLALALLEQDRAAALVMLRDAEQHASEAHRSELSATLRSTIARIDGGPGAEETIRAALVTLVMTRDYQSRAACWLSLVVVLIRKGKLQSAGEELAALLAAVRETASPPELLWLTRVQRVVDHLAGRPAQAGDLEFNEAICAVAGGSAPESFARFDDPATRLVFEYCPSPLCLRKEVLEQQTGAKILRVVRDGADVVLPSGKTVNFEKRHLLRRLFLRICEASEADTAATADDLIEAGWPDEKMTYESALRRLYAGIRNLRKLGFEEEVITTEHGYALDPMLQVERVG